MTHLIEVLVRYSIVSSIPLPIVNNSIDLSAFFIEAFNQGYLSGEMYEELKSIFASQ